MYEKEFKVYKTDSQYYIKHILFTKFYVFFKEAISSYLLTKQLS